MLVRILKPSYCTFLKRYVAPGEVIQCPTDQTKAIEDGLIELVSLLPDPDKVIDIGYRDK